MLALFLITVVFFSVSAQSIAVPDHGPGYCETLHFAAIPILQLVGYGGDGFQKRACERGTGAPAQVFALAFNGALFAQNLGRAARHGK